MCSLSRHREFTQRTHLTCMCSAVHSQRVEHMNTSTATKLQNIPPRTCGMHPHEIIVSDTPRHNTNVQILPQSHQPTHTVLQPQASYTQGLQLRSEDSSPLPLNHATLILRTCRLSAFHFMQLRLKALLIFLLSLSHNWVNILFLLRDDHHTVRCMESYDDCSSMCRK